MCWYHCWLDGVSPPSKNVKSRSHHIFKKIRNLTQIRADGLRAAVRFQMSLPQDVYTLCVDNLFVSPDVWCHLQGTNLVYVTTEFQHEEDGRDSGWISSWYLICFQNQYTFTSFEIQYVWHVGKTERNTGVSVQEKSSTNTGSVRKVRLNMWP